LKRVAAALLIGLGAAAAWAQDASPPAPSPTPSTSKPHVELTAADPVDIPGPMPIAPEGIAGAPVVRPRKAGEKKGLDFIAAPIPISNPTLGTGLAGVAAILFPISSKDDISPPATVGVGGFFTDNHSWAVAAAAKLYLDEDHWRVLGGVAKGEIHYRLAPAGTRAGHDVSIPIEQPVTGVVGELLRRVTGKLFLGARYTRADTQIHLDAEDEGETAPPLRDRAVTAAALGLRAQTDSRDSTFFPTQGTLFDLRSDFYDPAFGGTRSYQSYKASVNKYVSLGERSVVAARLSACDVRGDAPVYALCLFGTNGDLRGYEVGRYLDRTMWSAQAEFRWSLPEELGFFGRFGFVGFVGVGEVARSFADVNADDLLPGGGVGIRFLLSKENPVRFRIDYAWGTAGNRGLIIGVGESF
jgi:hypothetical protein